MHIDKLVTGFADLAKEHADLVALMEASIDPQLLVAVEKAYNNVVDNEPLSELNISYEGTIYA